MGERNLRMKYYLKLITLTIGAVLIWAAGIRALIKLFTDGSFDSWAAILVIGCILMSVGSFLQKCP